MTQAPETDIRANSSGRMMIAFLSHFADVALAWLETHWPVVALAYAAGVFALVAWVCFDHVDMDNSHEEI